MFTHLRETSSVHLVQLSKSALDRRLDAREDLKSGESERAAEEYLMNTHPLSDG